MNIKRILAAALAVCSVMSVTACGGGSDSGSAPSTPATTIDNPLDEEAKEALADVASGDLLTGELENKTIKWLSHWDINPDSSGKKTPVELELFQQKYGGVIEYYPTSWENRYSDLSTKVLGGDGIDFFPAGDMDAFPMGAISDMFQGYDQYVDWSSPLWSNVKHINDQFMWGDDHMVVVTQATDSVVVIYNRQTIEENGLDDPADLLAAGNWTWDTFKDMLKEFVDPENEKYGIDGYWFEAAILKTTGVPTVGIEDGKLVSNLKNEAMDRVMNYQADLYNNGYVFDKSQYNWNEQPQFIGEGKTLFYPCGLYALYYEESLWKAKLGDDAMFVPMPKDPAADEYYLPGGIDGVCICKGAQNPEGVIKFAECKMVAATDPKAVEVSENELRNTYGWTDEMIDMKKTVVEMTNAHPIYDFYTGVNKDITSILDSGETGIRAALQSGKSWATTKGEIADAIEEWINDVNVSAGVA